MLAGMGMNGFTANTCSTRQPLPSASSDTCHLRCRAETARSRADSGAGRADVQVATGRLGACSRGAAAARPLSVGCSPALEIPHELGLHQPEHQQPSRCVLLHPQLHVKGPRDCQEPPLARLVQGAGGGGRSTGKSVADLLGGPLARGSVKAAPSPRVGRDGFGSAAADTPCLQHIMSWHRAPPFPFPPEICPRAGLAVPIMCCLTGCVGRPPPPKTHTHKHILTCTSRVLPSTRVALELTTLLNTRLAAP